MCPKACLHTIFHLLPARDKASVIRTSKAVRQALGPSILSVIVSITKSDRESRATALLRRLPPGARLRSLKLQPKGKVNRLDPSADHEGLEASLAAFLQAGAVSRTGAAGGSQGQGSQAGPVPWSSVQWVHMESFRLGMTALPYVGISVPTLVHFSLKDVTLDVESLMGLLSCTSLEVIILISVSFKPRRSKGQPPLTAPQQAAAEASAQAAGVKAFEILGSLPRLHTLGLASMTVPRLDFLPALRGLTCLRLSRCDFPVATAGALLAGNADGFSPWTAALATISPQGSGVAPGFAPGGAAALPGLKSFEMTASPSGPLASAAFDLPAAQVLARLAPRLTSISLGILGEVTHAAATHMASTLTSLTSLRARDITPDPAAVDLLLVAAASLKDDVKRYREFQLKSEADPAARHRLSIRELAGVIATMESKRRKQHSTVPGSFPGAPSRGTNTTASGSPLLARQAAGAGGRGPQPSSTAAAGAAATAGLSGAAEAALLTAQHAMSYGFSGFLEQQFPRLASRSASGTARAGTPQAEEATAAGTPAAGRQGTARADTPQGAEAAAGTPSTGRQAAPRVGTPQGTEAPAGTPPPAERKGAGAKSRGAAGGVATEARGAATGRGRGADKDSSPAPGKQRPAAATAAGEEPATKRARTSGTTARGPASTPVQGTPPATDTESQQEPGTQAGQGSTPEPEPEEVRVLRAPAFDAALRVATQTVGVLAVADCLRPPAGFSGSKLLGGSSGALTSSTTAVQPGGSTAGTGGTGGTQGGGLTHLRLRHLYLAHPTLASLLLIDTSALVVPLEVGRLKVPESQVTLSFPAFYHLKSHWDAVAQRGAVGLGTLTTPGGVASTTRGGVAAIQSGGVAGAGGVSGAGTGGTGDLGGAAAGVAGATAAGASWEEPSLDILAALTAADYSDSSFSHTGAYFSWTNSSSSSSAFSRGYTTGGAGGGGGSGGGWFGADSWARHALTVSFERRTVQQTVADSFRAQAAERMSVVCDVTKHLEAEATLAMAASAQSQPSVSITLQQLRSKLSGAVGPALVQLQDLEKACMNGACMSWGACADVCAALSLVAPQLRSLRVDGAPGSHEAAMMLGRMKLQCLILESCIVEPHTLPSLLLSAPTGRPDRLVLGASCVGVTATGLGTALAAFSSPHNSQLRRLRVELVKGLLPPVVLASLSSELVYVASFVTLNMRDALSYP